MTHSGEKPPFSNWTLLIVLQLCLTAKCQSDCTDVLCGLHWTEYTTLYSSVLIHCIALAIYYVYCTLHCQSALDWMYYCTIVKTKSMANWTEHQTSHLTSLTFLALQKCRMTVPPHCSAVYYIRRLGRALRQFPNGCFSLDTLLPQVPPTQHHCQLSKHKWESTLHNAQCSPHCWRHQNGVKETWLQLIAPEAECKEASLEERQLQLSDIYSTFGTAVAGRDKLSKWLV